MEMKKIGDGDYQQIAAIYLEGIETGNATFQTEAPDWNSWDKNHLRDCRIGLFEDNKSSFSESVCLLAFF